jgi:hypothetical protein
MCMMIRSSSFFRFVYIMFSNHFLSSQFLYIPLGIFPLEFNILLSISMYPTMQLSLPSSSSIIILRSFVSFRISTFTCAVWIDCFRSCACRKLRCRSASRRLRCRHRIVDGEIASGCASAPFPHISSSHSPRRPTQSAIMWGKLAVGILDLCRRHSDILSSRGTFSAFRQTQRTGIHRRYCGRPVFPFLFLRLCRMHRR